MRIGAVVFWVVVAAVLGVVAVQTRPGATPAPTDAPPTLGVDPATTVAIEMREPGGDPVRVERGSVGSAWVVSWTDDSGEQRTWAADPDLTRAGLRVLATAELEARDGGPVGDDATELTITNEGGVGTVVRIGDRAVGGRTEGELVGDHGDRRTVWMGSRFVDALRRASVLRWRDPRLADAAPDLTQIDIRAGDAGVSLARVGGVWFVDAPAGVSADRGAVDRLIAKLGEVRAESFVDRPMPDADTGLASPIATIEVRATGERERVRTLAVGQGVDAGVSAVFVRTTGTDGGRAVGPVLARVTGDALAAIGVNPEAYVRRTPIDPGGFDVGRVTVGGVGSEGTPYARSIDGWRREGADGRSPESARLDALLGVLTRTEASSIRTDSTGEAFATVRVRDAARGQDLAFQVSRAEGGGYAVSLATGAMVVTWVYDAGVADDAFKWVAAQAESE